MGKIKTREGNPHLRQLFSTARTTANTTHSGLKNTTFLVNFIPTEKIDQSPMQVRTHFSEDEINVLAESIKEHGVLQPILVIQNGDRYQVIAGERRLRASRKAGIDRIPARVLSAADQQAQEINLRENLDRVDLHPIEEGEGYLTLLEQQFYTSHETIAKAFGKPKSRVTECISFTRLPETTKEELLKRGLKQRALMRKLLNVAPEHHMELIAAATGFEESGELPFKAPDAAMAATADSTAATATLKPKREPKPFEWRLDKKGFNMPGFKWKAGEGKEKLQQFYEALKQIATAIEKHLED
jgi:ParB family chromosome partitioning protein